jgi:hypothetical protein
MNIDQTFCVSDCKNWDCDRMLDYKALKIAERRGKEISQADLSVDCKEYTLVEPARFTQRLTTKEGKTMKGFIVAVEFKDGSKEGVFLTDENDAIFAMTGKKQGFAAGTSSLSEAFRELYADDGLPMTMTKIGSDKD